MSLYTSYTEHVIGQLKSSATVIIFYHLLANNTLKLVVDRDYVLTLTLMYPEADECVGMTCCITPAHYLKELM